MHSLYRVLETTLCQMVSVIVLQFLPIIGSGSHVAFFV